MKRWFVVAWILAAPAALAYHLVAGPAHLQLEFVSSHRNAGRAMVAKENWSQAIFHFEQALEQVPEDRTELQREMRLELAQAKMHSTQLPAAHEELKALLDESLEDATASPVLEHRIRESMASAQYYMTWLMRLEGASIQEWEPEIESARQNYRLLAERAAVAGNETEIRRQQENVEASVRLARMDLTDLQGLPLPCQCRGCCSGKCASRKPGAKKDGQQQPKDARGASAEEPGDREGS